MKAKHLVVSILFWAWASSCSKPKPLFETLSATSTGISFENKLTETEANNILAYEYFYNGGGLGAGDFNNDGLVDLYFSANQKPNELHLNTGNLKFKKTSAGLEGKKDAWKTGVSVIDINRDGWLDIYLCYSGQGNAESRKNQLFINQGLKNGTWSKNFIDQAEAYGLADAGRSTQAAFADFDLDGDLDAYVMNHNLKNYQRKEAVLMKTDVDSLAGDRLYENRNGKFINVSQQKGIKSNPLGFGLGLCVSDINADGYPDIYVANDYVEEDYLYINQKNGSFLDQGKTAMGHFSYSSMGVDIADINNDSRPDIFTCDMLPPDSPRQKLLAFPDNWNVQKSMLDNGFHWQNMRNMLQLNQGEIQNKLRFAEIGQMAGIAATDWSWAPILADFDGDGLKDIFVSNGFVKDLTNLDFVKYYLDLSTQGQQNKSGVSYLEMLKKMPSTATHHFAFSNNANLGFEDKSQDWGLSANKIASGALAIDLDQDGDLEIVTNNTNEPSIIYKNTLQENKKTAFVQIENLKLGDKIMVYLPQTIISQEYFPVRGFQSSAFGPLCIGLGINTKIDSITILSLDTQQKTIKNPALGKVINAKNLVSTILTQVADLQTIFQENDPISIDLKENEFLDFSRQILLPKLYSQQGAPLAKGDVNNDGFEDLFIGAPSGKTNGLFLGKANGKFEKMAQNFKPNLEQEDKDIVFFDANGDKLLDIYIAAGGYEFTLEDSVQQDRLYINTGKAGFRKADLPKEYSNNSKIFPFDIDSDGDIDLFLGGSIRSGLFPFADPSIVMKNNGKGQFTISQKLDLGMVSGIVKISDKKLAVATELGPVKIMEIKSDTLFVGEKLLPEGWYASMIADDLDGDGDQDIIVGNIGLNTALKASEMQPLQILAGDADQNMIIDIMIGQHYGDKAYPIYGRDELLEQSTFLKKKYTDYRSFSEALFSDILNTEQMNRMEKFNLKNLASGILWNQAGKFTWKPFPLPAQVAPVYAILALDIDHDNKKEILLFGNEQNFRIRIGKADANSVGVLKLQPNGIYKTLDPSKIGIHIKGDVKNASFINNQLLFTESNIGLRRFSLRKI